MCDPSTVKENGLARSIYASMMMFDDKIAVLNGNSLDKQRNSMDVDGILDEQLEFSEKNEGLTYSELEVFVDQLAAQLYHRFGVREGDTVFIACESFTTAEITALIACIRIRATFVPIDLKWLSDKNKMNYIVADVQPVAAIIVGLQYDDNETAKLLSEIGVFRCALISADGALSDCDISIGDIREDLPPIEEEPSPYPLYIMYTSGSTGFPKGVRGTERGLINRIVWQMNAIPWNDGEDDGYLEEGGGDEVEEGGDRGGDEVEEGGDRGGDEVVVRRTPLTFVDSMAEIFGTLIGGKTLWIPPVSVMASAGVAGIASLARDVGATRITLLPSQLITAMKVTSTASATLGSIWPSLKVVIVSGERCDAEVADMFRRDVPHALLVNLYGSTEVAGDVTFAILAKDEDDESVELCDELYNSRVPIGYPIAGNDLFVVKERCVDTNGVTIFDTMPPGECGELVVSGAHVSDGYHHLASHSAKAAFISEYIIYDNQQVVLVRGSGFTEDSNKDLEAPRGTALFRTGDVVVMSEESLALYWLGRRDNQVKVRGVRIELEEVEAVIAKRLEERIRDYNSDILHTSCLASVAAVVVTPNAHSNSDNSLNASSQDGTSNSSQVMLVVFVIKDILQEARMSSHGDLRGYLMSCLPSSLMPHLLLTVPEIYKTSSGKIDRPKLKEELWNMLAVDESPIIEPGSEHDVSKSGSGTRDRQTSSTSVNQEELFNILQGILPGLKVTLNIDTPSWSVDRNFYDLGGDSMLAIELLWAIKKNFLIDLSVSDLRLCINDLLYKIDHQADVISNVLSPSKVDIIHHTTLGLPGEQDVVLKESHPNPKRMKTNKEESLTESTIEVVTILERANRNEASSAFGLEWSENGSDTELNSLSLQVEWKNTFLKCVDASPILVDYANTSGSVVRSLLFIGSHDGEVRGIVKDTGETAWSLSLTSCFIGVTQLHIEGAISCAKNGCIVFVSAYVANDIHGLGNNSSGEGWSIYSQRESIGDALGVLVALDALTGSILWSSKDVIKGELKGSATIIDRLNAVAVGDYDGKVYLFHSLLGDLLSTLDASQGPIFASPVLWSGESDTRLYVATVRGGVVAWTLEASDSSKAIRHSILFSVSCDSPVYGTPIVKTLKRKMSKDETISQQRYALVFGCIDGSIISLDMGTGEVIHKFVSASTRPIFSTISALGPTPSCTANMIFGSHDGYLRCMEVESGAILFEFDVGGVLFSSPFVFDVVLRQNSPRFERLAVLCTVGGEVVVVNFIHQSSIDENSLMTCTLLAKLRLPGEIYSSPIVSNEFIYVGCRDDSLYCLKLI